MLGRRFQREPLTPVSGDAFQHGVLQPVAEGGEALGIFRHTASGEFGGGAESCDAGDVFGAGPAIAFVMAAVGDGREAGSFAYVERSDALGRVELVAAHAVEIDAERARRPRALCREPARHRRGRRHGTGARTGIAEGEGYANAAEFRVAHEQYWRSYLDDLRARLDDPSFDLSDDTEVAAERFRIAEVPSELGDGLVPRIRPAYPADRPLVDAYLTEHNSAVVARLGELVDARRQPALIAEGANGQPSGVLSWILEGASMEVLTLHAQERWHGTGTSLLAAARRVAEASGARRLWLITTNDNVDALRFYQRRGFALARLHAGAVDRSRQTLKPSIPKLGLHGVPIRDELELEVSLGGGS